MSEVKVKPLNPISAEAAIKKADTEIRETMSGNQVFFATRSNGLNRAMVGGFRPKNNYLIAGMSGVGKSYFLNILHNDFLNPKLNPQWYDKIKILHFNFDMMLEDEMMRSIAGQTGMDYQTLISPDTKLTEQQYTEQLKPAMDSISAKSIFYVEEPSDKYRIYETIRAFCHKFEGYQIIVSLDHSLMVKRSVDEKGEIETVSEIAKKFKEARKDFGITAIMLGQLNSDIERVERISSPVHQIPKRSDIFGSKQMLHAVDGAIVIHRPELLGLESYGTKNWNTKDLLAVHFIKMRKFIPSVVRLRQNFATSSLEDWEQSRYGL